jgi:hypothetical protein
MDIAKVTPRQWVMQNLEKNLNGLTTISRKSEGTNKKNVLCVQPWSSKCSIESQKKSAIGPFEDMDLDQESKKCDKFVVTKKSTILKKKR